MRNDELLRRGSPLPGTRALHGSRNEDARAAVAMGRYGASVGAGGRCHTRAVDLDLPVEHALLRRTVRDYMEGEVAPVIDAHEHDHRFPSEVVRRLGEMGWLGIPIPEEWGGAGMDVLSYAIAVEEIGRVWGRSEEHTSEL